MSREQDWKTQAVCRTVTDPEVFFPATVLGRNADDVHAPARRICATCPVTVDCLSDAMDHERGMARFYRSGVWGGLSPRQRADLHRSTHSRGTTA
jgi:WhiB family redox-sensing transcriptional regulator